MLSTHGDPGGVFTSLDVWHTDCALCLLSRASQPSLCTTAVTALVVPGAWTLVACAAVVPRTSFASPETGRERRHVRGAVARTAT